jgi:hypothetical protein
LVLNVVLANSIGNPARRAFKARFGFPFVHHAHPAPQLFKDAAVGDGLAHIGPRFPDRASGPFVVLSRKRAALSLVKVRHPTSSIEAVGSLVPQGHGRSDSKNRASAALRPAAPPGSRRYRLCHDHVWKCGLNSMSRWMIPFLFIELTDLAPRRTDRTNLC